MEQVNRDTEVLIAFLAGELTARYASELVDCTVEEFREWGQMRITVAKNRAIRSATAPEREKTGR